MEPPAEVIADDQFLRVKTASGVVEMTTNTVTLPGCPPIRLAPGPMAVMRVLARAQGAVISREHLLRMLPQCGSAHGLEMWISRLRHALPEAAVVQTVVKRGYRLAL
ncbi:winged helix-turn-helix domain-containing protein [Nesterenkonia sp. NBAIMH1]|uniref:winged helix-turn-helix domain-containing protein n=1 Tax=Nesterenkonia sp. NBAIMH1 TaxID=2600320 RepID=UPI001FEDD291|nr:winged helix-turn-helix domain-containing protein [Nesterenkonia sp. NBAIMH1]